MTARGVGGERTAWALADNFSRRRRRSPARRYSPALFLRLIPHHHRFPAQRPFQTTFLLPHLRPRQLSMTTAPKRPVLTALEPAVMAEMLV